MGARFGEASVMQGEPLAGCRFEPLIENALASRAGAVIDSC
jgi:hypothetical protein